MSRRFFTDSEGRRRPMDQSLFREPARSELYSRNIRWDSPADARRSVRFADTRWSSLKGRHKERTHLLQAMNQAANRAKVSEGEGSEAHRVLRSWVVDHKGKE